MKEIKLELCTLKDIKQSLEYTQAELDEVKGNVAALETQTKSQTAKIIRLQQTATENQRENSSAKEHLLKIDIYSRRENLIFSGVPEEENERPVIILEISLNLIETKLKISHANQMKIQRCHRLGSPRKGTRDIIIRFAYFGDRQNVWKERLKFKGSNIFVKEDFCQEITDRRSKLYPVYKAAKNCKMKVKLVADTLTVEGKRYTIHSLDKLPDKLQPKHLSELKTDSVIFFYDSYLSNFFRVNFMINGINYLSVEQYYQYQKAKLVNNEEIASKILTSVYPKEQHQLGKLLKTEGTQWNLKLKKQIMETAVFAKFDKNADLKSDLLSTGNKMIAECNPHVQMWSCGLSLQTAQASDVSKWKG